jgi:hypothetical protein
MTTPTPATNSWSMSCRIWLRIFFCGPSWKCGRIAATVLYNSRKEAVRWEMNGLVILRPIWRSSWPTATSHKCSPTSVGPKTPISLDWKRNTWQYYCFMFYCVSFLPSPRQYNISAAVSSSLIGFWGAKKERKISSNHSLSISVTRFVFLLS